MLECWGEITDDARNKKVVDAKHNPLPTFSVQQQWTIYLWYKFYDKGLDTAEDDEYP
jgi:hypothetical protein